MAVSFVYDFFMGFSAAGGIPKFGATGSDIQVINYKFKTLQSGSTPFESFMDLS